MAIPVTVGSATIGALLILGAEAADTIGMRMVKFAALGLATFFVGLLLYAGVFIERILKKRGILILSKLTGLILSALSAQMVFTGIRNFLSLAAK